MKQTGIHTIKTGHRQRGASGTLPAHLKSVHPFHVWPPGCCIHPILYLKKVPTPSGFWPPRCEILATGLNTNPENLCFEQKHMSVLT